MKNIEILASEARTVTGSVSAVTDGIGVKLFLNITAVSGTSPTLDVKVQQFDPVSGNYCDVAGCAFAQKTTTGIDDLTIYPGVTVVANRAVSTVLSDHLLLVYTIGGTDTPTFTFSVGCISYR